MELFYHPGPCSTLMQVMPVVDNTKPMIVDLCGTIVNKIRGASEICEIIFLKL